MILLLPAGDALAFASVRAATAYPRLFFQAWSIPFMAILVISRQTASRISRF
jgi:hypothetical protein